MNITPQTEPTAVEEQCLLDLFRSLNPHVQSDVLLDVLMVAVGLRSTPQVSRDSAEWEQFEEFIRHQQPWTWPEQGSIDLGNLGDPGFWLEEGLGESWITVLFGNPDDAHYSERLAESYVDYLLEHDVHLPSDFAENPATDTAHDEDIKAFTVGFGAFLKTWRTRVLDKVRQGTRARS